MGTFGLLAFRPTCSLCLAPDFNLLASIWTKCPSLVVVKAGRPDLPSVFVTLPRHKRQLAVVVLLRLIVELTARNHHMSGRSVLTLKTISAKRECPFPKCSHQVTGNSFFDNV